MTLLEGCESIVKLQSTKLRRRIFNSNVKYLVLMKDKNISELLNTCNLLSLNYFLNNLIYKVNNVSLKDVKKNELLGKKKSMLSVTIMTVLKIFVRHEEILVNKTATKCIYTKY